MKQLTTAELWAAPELALVPPLLAAVDATLAILRAQHATIDDEWLPTDPRSLRVARVLAADLARTRAALLTYLRAIRCSLHEQVRDDDSSLPF